MPPPPDELEQLPDTLHCPSLPQTAKGEPLKPLAHVPAQLLFTALPAHVVFHVALPPLGTALQVTAVMDGSRVVQRLPLHARRQPRLLISMHQRQQPSP